jgi:hypothetical protein
MSLNISNLITDNTNIIEIYMCNPLKTKEDLKIDIHINNDILNNIRKKFKLTKQTTLVYYNRNNLCYVYDLSNDSQYLYLRKLENNYDYNKLYGLAFNEMKMQSHSFACTNEIDNKCEYNVEEFKINNRISLIIKNNNLYISYKHSKEVEIDKIQEIINKIITKILT